MAPKDRSTLRKTTEHRLPAFALLVSLSDSF
jgi:hypothetical protein